MIVHCKYGKKRRITPIWPTVAVTVYYCMSHVSRYCLSIAFWFPVGSRISPLFVHLFVSAEIDSCGSGLGVGIYFKRRRKDQVLLVGLPLALLIIVLKPRKRDRERKRELAKIHKEC